MDVPWSPYDVDGRNYDWLGLAEAADILFVMSYDMQSQVMDGSCSRKLVERGWGKEKGGEGQDGPCGMCGGESQDCC